MNYVKDPKKVGGMISSIGFAQQDCVSVKYMFDYLEKGLEEISFETENDFCIVLNNGKKIYVQVKINQFTLEYVSKLLSEDDIRDNTIFIGTGYDDSFRNLIKDKERYLAGMNSVLCSDKDELYKEIDAWCQKKKINTNKFLKFDFQEMGGANKEDIAKSAIDSWARKKGIFVDTDRLFDVLIAMISNRLRTFGGHLSQKDIMDIISQYRSSKIETFVPKKDRISTKYEQFCKRDIIECIDALIVKYKYLEDKLLIIKYHLQSEQIVEARNRIEEIVDMCPEIKAIFLMVLNLCGQYDDVIKREEKNDTVDCLVEYAKAYMYKQEYGESQNYLELIEKDVWDSTILYLSAINHNGMGTVDIAKQELEQCINENKNFVDAYVFLASLIYISETEQAVEYLNKALTIDSKYPKAYMLMANISELSDDFALVVENYEKYIEYSGDDENENVLIKLATNKYHLKTNDWKTAFIKWNELFRKNRNVEGEINQLVIDLGISYCWKFLLRSTNDGLIVECNGKEIMSYCKGKYQARTVIGLYELAIDANMMRFSMQDVSNPIRKSSRSIFQELALPAIFKFYDEYEAYSETLNMLLEQKVLRLNHIFEDDIKEYRICEEDIEVNLQVNGNKLKGEAMIGDIILNIEINPLTKSLDVFRQQLEKPCGFNEAAIILCFNEEHQTQLIFPKKKMNLKTIG